MNLFEIENIEQLEEFINNGGNIKELDYTNKTPLFYKHVYSNEELFKKMVEYGIDINHHDNDCQLALHMPKEAKYLELMIKYGADVSYDPDGIPPLFFFTDNKECLSVLLNNGADINQTGLSGENALMQESLSNEIVDFLISKGININHKTNEGDNILFISDSAYAVKKAIEAGAEVNCLNKNGGNALFTQLSSETEIIVTLLENGINLNVLDYDGFSPFASNSIQDEVEILNKFIEYGWDMYQKSSNGLPIVYDFNNINMLRFLVEKGLDLTIENRKGENAFINCDSKEKLDFLVQHNVPIKKFPSQSPIIRRAIEKYLGVLQEKEVLVDILTSVDDIAINKKIRL